MKIFTYGTLMPSQNMNSVCGRDVGRSFPAILNGYKKVGLNILKDPMSSVSGTEYDVNENDLVNLDRYEGVAGGLYRRIAVTFNDGHEAIAYEKVNPETPIYSGFGAG